MTRYRTIVADPPWAYSSAPPSGKADRKAKPDAFYSTMTHGEIAGLPVAGLAADVAHLYLWVTNTLLFEERDGWRPSSTRRTAHHSAKPDAFWGDQSLGTADMSEVA